LYDNTLMVSG